MVTFITDFRLQLLLYNCTEIFVIHAVKLRLLVETEDYFMLQNKILDRILFVLTEFFFCIFLKFVLSMIVLLQILQNCWPQLRRVLGRSGYQMIAQHQWIMSPLWDNWTITHY